MRVYRNHYANSGDPGESTGFHFFSSKKAAIQHAAKNTPWNGQKDQIAYLIEFDPTKEGILGLLNRWAGHPDNG